MIHMPFPPFRGTREALVRLFAPPRSAAYLHLGLPPPFSLRVVTLFRGGETPVREAATPLFTCVVFSEFATKPVPLRGRFLPFLSLPRRTFLVWIVLWWTVDSVALFSQLSCFHLLSRRLGVTLRPRSFDFGPRRLAVVYVPFPDSADLFFLARPAFRPRIPIFGLPP